MRKVELSDKQLTYIILALERYSKMLAEDEEEPGPSMMDSLFAADLAKKLRECASQTAPTERQSVESTT